MKCAGRFFICFFIHGRRIQRDPSENSKKIANLNENDKWTLNDNTHAYPVAAAEYSIKL